MTPRTTFSGRRLAVALIGAVCVAVFPAAAFGAAPGGVITADHATTVDPATAPQLESPAPPAGVMANRPELPMAQYQQAKAAVGAAPTASKPAVQSPLATTLSMGAPGQSQGAPGPSLSPPDSSGAASSTQEVQGLNSKLAVYNTGTSSVPSPQLVCANSFATLTGYTTQTLFDPRVVYDNIWNRWVVSVEAFPESSTVQRQFLLISRSGNACGAWWVYNFDVNYLNTSSAFWDFPDLGMTQDAVILTANLFNPNFAGSNAMAIAKARLYNGLGFSVPIFTNLGSTQAPPIVLDQAPCASLLQARVGTATVGIRSFCNAENAFAATMSGMATINVGNTIFVPPGARQSGCSATSCSIDTSDGRFSSQTWQYGSTLWAAHTITLNGVSGGLPTPKYYQINTSNNSVISQAFFFNNGGLPDDYNASIAARTNGTIYFTWNSSGPSSFVQVRVGGKTASGAASQALVSTASATLTGNFDPNFGNQRWGDYSNTWPDNANATRAWAFDERVASSSLWGTRLERFTQS